MKVKLIYILFLILVLSCKKGGIGGSTTVVVTVTHHGKGIQNAKVYIKYGSYNFPGADTSIYKSKQITGTDAYTKFKNLKTGYYYFYVIGYDSTSMSVVTGNAGLKIKHKEIGNELEINVPVTE